VVELDLPFPPSVNASPHWAARGPEKNSGRRGVGNRPLRMACVNTPACHRSYAIVPWRTLKVKRLDVLFLTHAEARAWGVRHLSVPVTTP